MMRPDSDQTVSRHDHNEAGFHPSLSRAEVVAIIDALLQAEMTLPLLDGRNRHLPPVHRIRSLQLSLADRLEDLLASSAGNRPAPS